MKKLFLFLIIPILGLVVFYYLEREPAITQKPLPSPAIKENLTREKLDPIIINGATYYFSHLIIDQFEKLKLLPNFKDQLASIDLIDKHNCSVLVNAGFYSEDYKPLGWLVSEKTEISKPITSQLFNGFLSVNNNRLSISSYLKDDSKLGFQSGPILVQNSQPLSLKIRNDQLRRRIIAAQTKDGSLLFMVITSPDSLFLGPLLADTPKIVIAIASQLKTPIIHALNLDGGSASVFYNQKVHIKEFSPVGSFFCLTS